ncbi:MAG: hypothetical protein WAX04_05010, partial [Oscillospiraceae bacterium]
MKKLLCIILSACMICGMLSGCGDEKQPPTENESITTYTTEGKVTKLVPDLNAAGELTISSPLYYNPNREDNYFVIAKRMFQELYPNVKLTYDMQPTIK